jgi:hypothetical protein
VRILCYAQHLTGVGHFFRMHALDLFEEQAAEHHDAAVGVDQHLARAVGDRPLADPCHDVAAVDEVGQERPALVLERDLVDRNLLLDRRLGLHLRQVAGVPENKRVHVVYRHADLKAVLALGADPNHQREHQWMADPPIIVRAAPAGEHAPLDDPVAEHVEADLYVPPRVAARDAEPGRAANRSEMMAVEPFQMRRIDAVLHDLQPVARNERAADVAQHALPDE